MISQPVSHTSNSPPAKFIPFQSAERDVVGDTVKSVAEVQIDDIFSFVHWHSYTAIKRSKDLPLAKPCWLSHIPSLSSMCMTCRRICSSIFSGTGVRLTGWLGCCVLCSQKSSYSLCSWFNSCQRKLGMYIKTTLVHICIFLSLLFF